MPSPFNVFKRMVKANPKMNKKAREKAIESYRRRYYKVKKRL